MNTLNGYTLIYDNECPLCNFYTKGFIKSGMLDEKGIECYTQFPLEKIDVDKARNEIALINRETGDAIYGIDSLFCIIGNSLPWLKPLFRLKWFKLAATKLYSFISYNRKVIAPGKRFEPNGSCTPDFNLNYRMIYILITWLITSFVLYRFSSLMTPIVPASNFYREFIICGGQIVFQFAAISMLNKKRVIHYLGNMMTISLIGALLLLPLCFFNNFILSPWLAIAYFLAVVCLMFYEHNRRVKILEISPWASISWVAYRLMILVMIYFFNL